MDADSDQDSDDGIEAQYRAIMRREVDESRDTTTKKELQRLYTEEGRAIKNTLKDFLESVWDPACNYYGCSWQLF